MAKVNSYNYNRNSNINAGNHKLWFTHLYDFTFLGQFNNHTDKKNNNAMESVRLQSYTNDSHNTSDNNNDSNTHYQYYHDDTHNDNHISTRKSINNDQ